MISKFLKNIKKDRYLLAAILLLLIGAFLRIYKFDAFVTFLGDQGRDTIIIKRILSFEHFPAIGPVSSVGNIYLGPFYYYFIAPWLLLSGFDPLGPAIGVFFFSSLFIIVNYLIVKELINKKTALLSTLFLAFSTTLIDFSRFSWNPNLLPFFTLLLIYFVIKSFQTNKWYHFVLAGAFLSFCVQLHYLALFLLPPLGIYLLMQIFSDKKNFRKYVKGNLFTFASFLFFSLPLLIFDLRHDFINSRAFLKLFLTTGNVADDKFAVFQNTLTSLNKYVFQTGVNFIISLAIVIMTVISFFYLKKSGNQIKAFILFFIISLVGISLYGGPKHPHYFAIIYPTYLIIISFFLTQLSGIWGKILIVLFVLGFLFLNSQKYYFFYEKGSYQVARAKKVSKVIHDNVQANEYFLTALPEVYSDYTPRYFLEIWNKKPLERGEESATNELFVICEQPCKPIGNPLYDIAKFGPRKILGTWQVEDVTIYKLTK